MAAPALACNSADRGLVLLPSRRSVAPFGLAAAGPTDERAAAVWRRTPLAVAVGRSRTDACSWVRAGGTSTKRLRTTVLTASATISGATTGADTAVMAVTAAVCRSPAASAATASTISLGSEDTSAPVASAATTIWPPTYPTSATSEVSAWRSVGSMSGTAAGMLGRLTGPTASSSPGGTIATGAAASETAAGAGAAAIAVWASTTSSTALPPSRAALAASSASIRLTTLTGAESVGCWAMASRNARSSMLPGAALPADSSTGGTRTSDWGTSTGLATTTVAPTSTTPVMTIAPMPRRTELTALLPIRDLEGT